VRSFTIAIPSHQRAAAVTRLVRELCRQAEVDPEGFAGVEVLVVLDGSDDGSKELLAAVTTGLELRVEWSPHVGVAAARNLCLAQAEGEVIYFLDDDLVPSPGTIAFHRRAHEPAGADLSLAGPCPVPDHHDVPVPTREFWCHHYDEHRKLGRTPRANRFLVANASFRVERLRRVGGFNTSLTGYGIEDYELGLRLMSDGLVQRFEDRAVAWHYTDVAAADRPRRARDEGRNVAGLVMVHGEGARQLLPEWYPGPAPWLIDLLAPRRPGLLYRLSEASGRLASHLRGPIGPIGRELSHLSYWSGFAAGILDRAPSLLPAALGRPTGGRRPTWRRPPPAPHASAADSPVGSGTEP
jgi:GT2 family glycosyltransferase